MIEFKYPFVLLLVLPYSVFVIWIAFNTKKSIHWISSNVSKRFIGSFTSIQKTLNFNAYFGLLYLTGVLLLVASSEPEIVGTVDNVKSLGNIIIVIDASQSMWAGDTIKHPKTKKKPYDRLTQAIETAQDFVDAYPQYSYGVVSFSRKAVIHSSAQNDPILAKTVLHSINIHNFESSGSSFKSVFQKLVGIVAKDPGITHQILFLSDGEIQSYEKEDFTEEIDILKNFGVRIHAIGVGKKTGGSVRYFVHYYNIQKEEAGIKKKDDSTGEKKVYYKEETVKNLTTKRDDSTLSEITEKTNGKYVVLEKGEYIDQFKDFLKKGEGTSSKRKINSNNSSASRFFNIPALILFILYSFVFFRKEKYIYDKNHKPLDQHESGQL